MSSSFEFDPVERVTVGAIGEPGQRIFYLQASGAGQLVTVLAEKEQVNALAQTIARLVTILPDTDDEGAEPTEDDLDLQEPLLIEWRAGAMALDYDEERDALVLIVREVLPEESEDEAASLRIAMSRAQASALAAHASEVVQAGRPACRVCGLPLDPEGHICPALNGHRESR